VSLSPAATILRLASSPAARRYSSLSVILSPGPAASAAAITSGVTDGPQVVSVPTAMIWGLEDAALCPRLSHGLDQWAPAPKVVRLPGASNWVQHDAPEQVDELLLKLAG
jgi:pimeloyl-ACP methyl ester carboxylesterase